MSISADARIYAGRSAKNCTVTLGIEHQACVLVADGQNELDGLVMKKRDGPQVIAQTEVTISPHFSPEYVARRLKDTSCMGFTTKGRHYVISICAGTRARRHG